MSAFEGRPPLQPFKPPAVTHAQNKRRLEGMPAQLETVVGEHPRQRHQRESAAGAPPHGNTWQASRSEIATVDSQNYGAKQKGKYNPQFGSGKRVALCSGIDDYPGTSEVGNGSKVSRAK